MSLRPPHPLGTHLAGGIAPGADAPVKLAPGAAPLAAQVPRLQDEAGKRRAGAARTEPGTAFAGAQAEAGAFVGRDRGNPETPGPCRAGRDDGGGSEPRCASGVTGDPAGTAAWGARRSGAAASGARSRRSCAGGERCALLGSCGHGRPGRASAGTAGQLPGAQEAACVRLVRRTSAGSGQSWLCGVERMK